jgi:hypothetical protein
MNGYYIRLATEALVVGLVLALVLRVLRPTSVPELILAGAAIHLGFEATGLNRVYCSTGAACR